MQTFRNGQFRRVIRYFGAIVSAVIAVIYLLIGSRVLIVLDGNGDQVFGLFACAAFILGAVLLVAFDRRILWILGALLQVFVIFTYFNLASQRAPAFESWGITLRIIQLPLLITLTYLALRAPLTPTASQDRQPI